ncbi:MAG: hypothetical protein ACR2OB_11875 [Solirubrobacteraceae bacterium]
MAAVTGGDAAGVGWPETIGVGWETPADGVGTLSPVCVEVAAGESDVRTLDAGAVDAVDAGAAAAEEGVLATGPATGADAVEDVLAGAAAAGAVTGAEEPLAAGPEGLAAPPLDAEPHSFFVELFVEFSAPAGVAPARELPADGGAVADAGALADAGAVADAGALADAGAAADEGANAAPEPAAGRCRDMPWSRTELEDAVLALWAV